MRVELFHISEVRIRYVQNKLLLDLQLHDILEVSGCSKFIIQITSRERMIVAYTGIKSSTMAWSQELNK